MFRQPWLNANRTSHLLRSDLPDQQIGPPWLHLSGNDHFLKSSVNRFSQKAETTAKSFSPVDSPFVTLALNCVFEDWKLRLIKEQVCQSAMINHKSIYVSASIHLWRWSGAHEINIRFYRLIRFYVFRQHSQHKKGSTAFEWCLIGILQETFQ